MECVLPLMLRRLLCTIHSHPPKYLLCLLKCISFTALLTAQCPPLVGDCRCSDGAEWQWGKIMENTQRKLCNSSHLWSNGFDSGKLSRILFIIHPFKKRQKSHSRMDSSMSRGLWREWKGQESGKVCKNTWRKNHVNENYGFSLRCALVYLFVCNVWLKFEEWDKTNSSGNRQLFCKKKKKR